MIIVRASSAAPVDSSWRVCSDLPRWPQHLETFSAVDRLDGSGPVGVGSRFAVRQPGLRDADYEITEWNSGESFTWEARLTGVRTVATHRVEADGPGSRITLGIDWSGPMAWLVRLLLGRKAQHLIQHEATTFARVAEAAPRS